MLQYRQTVIKFIDKYKLFLKNNNLPVGEDLSYKQLKDKGSRELFVLLNRVLSSLKHDFKQPFLLYDRQYIHLVESVTLFLEEHILYGEIIVSVKQRVAELLMEIVQDVTYRGSYISQQKEHDFLKNLEYVIMNGDLEQVNLCRKLLLDKKNLLREAVLKKARVILALRMDDQIEEIEQKREMSLAGEC